VIEFLDQIVIPLRFFGKISIESDFSPLDQIELIAYLILGVNMLIFFEFLLTK